MKVILSRKGFDSKYGSQPSPIMPDGTLLSLPIPSKNESIKFSDLNYNGKTYLEIIKDLKPRPKIKDKWTCHLDPDIKRNAIQRNGPWTPAFGQTGGAQGHLINQGVGRNDLFLFYGTFRMTELIDNKLKYIKGSPEAHIIFGYMQVGEFYSNKIKFPKEVFNHPHANGNFLKETNNCIYTPRENLSFSDSLNGSGCLNFHRDLVLTKPGESKSRWILPDFFKNVKMSYHSQNSFKNGYFQSVAIGQEFVLEENDEVTNWAKDLIIKGSQA